MPGDYIPLCALLSPPVGITPHVAERDVTEYLGWRQCRSGLLMAAPS
jgi:hypothetical protein